MKLLDELSSPEFERMVNQLWQGKQVSLNSPSFLLSSLVCGSPDKWWWVPMSPLSPLGERDRDCESCVTSSRLPESRLRVVAQLPPVSSGYAFIAKREKSPM